MQGNWCASLNIFVLTRNMRRYLEDSPLVSAQLLEIESASSKLAALQCMSESIKEELLSTVATMALID
jgi:hypothetical protein